MSRALYRMWQALRAVVGDDAYDRYVLHQRTTHPDTPCLSRKAFWLDHENRRWNRGMQRCC